MAEKQEEQQAGLAVWLSRAAEGKARKESNFPSRGRGTSRLRLGTCVLKDALSES